MTLSRAAEALLLVYDSEAALAAACSWAEALGSQQCDAAEVRLCVSTGAAVPAVEAAAAAWCLAHGYEHVPPPGDAAELPGEAQGGARVLEALHAHTWPGLVVKPRAPRPVPAAARVPDDLEAESEDFEALMGAMLQARDAAAGGGVSDEARRATAAALALRMAHLLGDGVEEEEEE